MLRFGYALVTLTLITLACAYGFRQFGGRKSLPSPALPADSAGLTCEQAFERARTAAARSEVEAARSFYLWMANACEDSPLLPDAVLEGASLSAHLLERPEEARQLYASFVERFPQEPRADVAMYQLARLEIDAGDYVAAVAHLTTLTQRYPHSSHLESAKFLAARTAELLAAQRHSLATIGGQLRELIPNNLWSFLAVIGALGPAFLKLRHASAGARALPLLILGLTILNYIINNVESATRNRELLAKLDRLSALQGQTP